MKKLFIRSTACLLAIMMLLSTAGCGAFNNQHDSAKGSSGVHVDPISQGNSTLTPGASTNTAVSDVQTATREELEQMLVSLSKGTFTLADAMAMSDKELKEKVQMYLDQLKGETGFTALPEGYDENGALTKPFDQLYPELVESEQVSYSKDALLLKLKNSSKGAVTKEMKAAGVVKLEAVVPMEETTWYKASLTEGTDVGDAVEALRQVKTVLMVDYDYEVKTSAIDHYKELPPDKGFENNKKHPEQWYLHHAGIPDGYKNMKNDGGSSSVVVAVIDTGVDYDHEDLAQNIWVNKGEVPDDGIDNDGNGYIDDYYGVNIITGKGNGDDDNGHGTHVAGIIAAQNNKLGIVGIAYNTKVMPIKAAMASGYLHQSDIAKAVLYAYEQGAEVINMSFGGTACSIAVQDALATAYTRCVLVASAGNDGAYNEGLGAIPNYPAALTYVLGVMSVDQDGRESYFTNWDVKAFNGVEYELYAPGNEIVSTIPGDRYATWSGTSMAAPMVSAIAAILRSEFTDRDTYPTRFIYGQLSATSEHTATCYNPQAHGDHNIPQIVNLFAALTKLPKPELGVQDSMHFDTLDGNGDGVIDAGETIELGFILRNRWGQSKDTLVTIDTLSQAGIADPYITILNDTVDYGSVGSYATGDCGKIFTDELLSGWEKPFRLKIADDCPNDYIFTLNITIRCKNGLDLEDDTTYVFGEKPYQFTIDLTVRNGTVLPAIIDEDMTLTPDHLYIIPNSTVIDEGVTVRVEPGTRIQFWSDDPDDPYADTYIPYLLVKGKFLVNGTAEDPVYIFPSDLMHNYNIEIAQSETGWVSLRHADITNFVYYITNTGYSNRIASAESCTFRFNYDLRDMNYRDLDSGKVSTHRFYSGSIGSITNANNCVFYKLGNTQSSLSLFGTFEHCAFVDCGIQFRGQYYDEGDANLRHCLLLGNHFVDQTKPNIYDNSSVTVSGKPSINVPYLYRCKENGTTYFYGPIDSFWAKKIGADYAIFETAEEWDQFTALDASRGGNYQVYTRYDVDKDRFVWADGSEIGAFADPNGAAISPKNPNGGIYIEKNYATGEHLLAYGNYGAYYYLYELKGNILPESIRFNEYEVSLDTGATYQISPISAPVQLPADRFLYECSDPSVLSVDATGKVTPLKQGTADVVVYSLDRAVKNYITFHVVDYVPLEGISLDKSELRLAVGEYAKLNCLFTPANTTRKHAIFTVADPKIASVDEGGVITPLSSGTTTVTVTCEGFTATAEIIVFVRATEFDFELPAVTYPLAEGEASLPTLTITKGAVTDIVYRSTEPGVASIANGKLILHKAGTTDIIAREQNSGLVAKITLYVTNGALSPVVDLKISGNDDFYALLANGDLYYWSYYQKKPVRIAQKVKAFDAYSAYSLVLYEDNTLAELNGNRVVKTWTDFKDRAPIDVGYNGNGGSSYYVLTENGRAYAWGRNDYGTLGVGSVAETIDRPTLVNLDAKIVDIHVSYYDTTWFVTENGSLYMAGAQNLQASAPILIAEGISAAWMEEYHLYYIDADGQLVYMEGYSESTDVRGDAPASTLITGGYGPWNNDNWSNIYLTYDNNTLTFHTGNRDTVLPTVGEVTAMAWMEYNSSTFWYATEDGMLYAFGSNRYNQFGGATTDSTSDKPVAIPLFPIVGDALTMTESNLSDTGILSEDQLVLTFNHALGSVSGIKMYSDCLQIPFTARIELDKLIITLGVGYEEGKTYGIVIPKDALTGTAGVTLTEDIVLSFGYKTEPAHGFDPMTGHIYQSVVTPPTCTTTGYTTHTCHCGDSYTDSYVNATGHTYTPIITPPTCTEAGYITHICHCGDMHLEEFGVIDLTSTVSVIDGNGINYTNTLTDKKVSVIADIGEWTSSSIHNPAYGINGNCYIEIDLNAVKDIYSIWAAHYIDGQRYYKWEAYASSDNTADISTWTKIGGKMNDDISTAEGFTLTLEAPISARYIRIYGMYNSANIGYHFSEIKVVGSHPNMGATGHSFGEWYNVGEFSCTELSQQQRDCQNCDHFETREALGHVFGDWYVTAEAGCVTNGEEQRDCENCDHFETRETLALGHTMGDWYVTAEATCTEDGEEQCDCENCDHFETRAIAAPGHVFGDWYVTTEETCTTDGEEQRDCINCEHFETRTIPAAHSFGDWYTYDADLGILRKDCQFCDYYKLHEPGLITIAPQFGAWENWHNSPNNPNGVGTWPGVTQLLVGITKDGEALEIAKELTWVLQIEGGGQNKTITLSPATTYTTSSFVLHRFETCLAEGDNQFIPVNGVNYTVTITVYDGDIMLYYSSPTSGFTCPMDPVVPTTVATASVALMNSAATEAEEKVVHESVTDTSIVRYYTAETLTAKFAEIQEQYQYNPAFYGNVILNHISTDYNVEHWLRPLAPETSGAKIPLGGNYWGTTNEKAIELQMIDYRDFITYGLFMYEPFLSAAPENTFPFVTDIQIFNKAGEEVTTVGREEITVRVHFNRDMDTTVPLSVLFGSAYPYGDYEITNGSYIDPRTWEGTYFVTTVIGDGNQYFTVTGGKAAGTDLQLFTDRQRFGFVIDTIAAQALIMQGQATETGIELSWTQDDFDTLMGYNVYRATSEDGLYTRINQTVIPSDTMTFFDDTVEPGVRYFYNFTVVQTDLTESIPSGKISLLSMDTMAPNIYHSPVYTASTGANLIVSATVTDNLHIVYAKVYYRSVGSDSWATAMMNNLNDKFSAIIPSDILSIEGLEYYIEAFDGVSYTYKGSADAPYTVTVQEAVSPSSLGDVNGDGMITNLDALMLLQAINDLYNLDAAQFARADLNGDGELAAVEALRILQYVSGKVGSVAM